MKKLTKLEIAELKGAAKILDMLWDNSYYRNGKETSELIEKEMIYLFGENWASTMYKFLGVKDSTRVSGVKPLELTKQQCKNK